MGVNPQIPALIMGLDGWDRVCEHPNPGYVVGITEYGPCTLVEITSYCDHYPCYETHDVQIIVRVQGEYYRRMAMYDSQNGFVLGSTVSHVQKGQKVVTVWE